MKKVIFILLILYSVFAQKNQLIYKANPQKSEPFSVIICKIENILEIAKIDTVDSVLWVETDGTFVYLYGDHPYPLKILPKNEFQYRILP